MTDAAEAGTLQLIITNIVLGVVCAALLVAVLGAAVAELVARLRGRDRDQPAPPDADPPRGRQKTLAELRGELPDGWPPQPDGRPRRRSAALV